MGSNDCLMDGSGNKQGERVRYFSRQLITADDLNQDQDYHREKRRLHNRFLHGWGIVCGLEVVLGPTSSAPLNITVHPGYALSPQGDEIYVAQDIQFDLGQCITGQSAPCSSPCAPVVLGAVDPKKAFYIAIRYSECPSRPVHVSPLGCGCDDTACEYSRIREGVELTCIGEGKLPANYSDQLTGIAEALVNNKVMPCSAHLYFPWVALAKVTLQGETSSGVSIDLLDSARRILLSTSAIQSLV